MLYLLFRKKKKLIPLTKYTLMQSNIHVTHCNFHGYKITSQLYTINLSQITFLQTIISVGLICLLPAYLVEMSLGYKLSIHIPFLLTLGYVVLFPGLTSFFFWIKGISIIGSNRAGIFLHLMPIFSASMAIMIFEEKFMIFHIIGAAAIITGIILSTIRT